MRFSTETAATVLAENRLLGPCFGTPTPQGEFKERGLHGSVLTQGKHHFGDDVSARRAPTANASLPAQAPKHEAQDSSPAARGKKKKVGHQTTLPSPSALGPRRAAGRARPPSRSPRNAALVAVVSPPGYAKQRGSKRLTGERSEGTNSDEAVWVLWAKVCGSAQKGP